jgi:DnaK suppressor protein
MPTKKPSVKPTKAKKTVSAKPTAAKKPVAKAASKSSATKSAAKPAAKPTGASQTKSAKPSKTVVTKPVAKSPIINPAKSLPKGSKSVAVKTATPAIKAPAKTTVAAESAKVKMPTPKTADKSIDKPAAKAAATLPQTSATKPAAAKIPSGPKPVVAVGVMEKKKQPAQNVSDSDDGEGEPGANLLAGPRNVTPYQVKRGEQYMNKVQLEHFHQILNRWKRDLMEEVDRTVVHMKDEAANFPDPNDRATQESEFSLELRTRDRERKLIRKIEEAIGRIEDGSYGYCSETGEEIGVKRLEARPVATLCVEAQERRERREKQYGDRDDRYR